MQPEILPPYIPRGRQRPSEAVLHEPLYDNDPSVPPTAGRNEASGDGGDFKVTLNVITKHRLSSLMLFKCAAALLFNDTHIMNHVYILFSEPSGRCQPRLIVLDLFLCFG